jgi:hypothetical protein
VPVPMDLTPRNPGSLVLARPGGAAFNLAVAASLPTTDRSCMETDEMHETRDSLLDMTPPPDVSECASSLLLLLSNHNVAIEQSIVIKVLSKGYLKHYVSGPLSSQ